MDKATVASILVFTLLVPFLAARARSTKAALRQALIGTAVACVVYLLGLLFVYTQAPKFGAAPGAHSSSTAA